MPVRIVADATSVIGIDFDNTIVTYDDLFHRLALESQLIDRGVSQNKRHVRDAVREGRDGERAWQQLQAQAYGPRITEAAIAAGVPEFLAACRSRRLPVFIVSHRTERASLGPTDTNLRDVAFDWMRTHGFFAADGFGVQENHVFFESTRADKVARIEAVGCTHFVDDLEEVFAEPAFPAHVTKILFAPNDAGREPIPGVAMVGNWKAIGDYLFG